MTRSDTWPSPGRTDPALAHLGLVGDTYTILLTGDDTAGRYTLIDMYVPPGGGPPPHRHDFEEMFTVLDGEVEPAFRGEHLVSRAGETVNVPANAPHAFTNASGRPARLLCMCSPPGQEEFFLAVSQPVATRTEAPPELDEAATGGVHRKIPGPCAAIPHRTAAALQAPGRSPTRRSGNSATAPLQARIAQPRARESRAARRRSPKPDHRQRPASRMRGMAIPASAAGARSVAITCNRYPASRRCR